MHVCAMLASGFWSSSCSSCESVHPEAGSVLGFPPEVPASIPRSLKHHNAFLCHVVFFTECCFVSSELQPNSLAADLIAVASNRHGHEAVAHDG